MDVFVIMPFDSELNSVYEKLIKTPLEQRGHSVRRADDAPQNQNILKTIVQGIWTADVIVTDLTQTNANVYYELGIAHALEKQTIQIVQNIDDVLFDLRPYYVIEYSTHFNEAGNLTTKIIELLEQKSEDEFQFNNPVSDFIYRDLDIPVEIAEDLLVTSLESHEDDTAMGMLEALVEAEDSMEEIVELVTDMTGEIQGLGQKIASHGSNLDRLNSNPNQPGLNRKKLKIVRLIAKDMNRFSDTMDVTVPRIDTSWDKLDKGLSYVLLSASIKTDSDLESVRSFIHSMSDLRESVRFAKSKLEDVLTPLAQGTGVSRDTDRAFRRSQKTFNRLINGLGYGDSVLTRLIGLADDMGDRYSSA